VDVVVVVASLGAYTAVGEVAASVVASVAVVAAAVVVVRVSDPPLSINQHQQLLYFPQKTSNESHQMTFSEKKKTCPEDQDVAVAVVAVVVAS